MLKKDFRAEIVRKMKKVVKVFPVLSPDMKAEHFLAIDRLRHTDFDKITDVRLIMLCGAHDCAFSAGCYGYTAEQNMALNDLEDSLCDLRNLIA
jgi:hypothetical protein